MGIRRWLGWPLVALTVFGAVALLRETGYLERFEHAAADTRARVLRQVVNSPIVVVGIDARSLAQLHQWPWPRRYHAQLLEQLQLAHPRRVFFDIDFSSPSNPEDDAALEQALASWSGQPIILPVFQQNFSGADEEVVLMRPIDRFARHAQLASVNLELSHDGLVRSLRTSWTHEGKTFRSAVAAISTPAPPAGKVVPIDYSISPASISFVSYADVVTGRVDRASLADKVVFIGNTSSELNDMFAVPVYRSRPGVVVQALAAETIRRGIPHAVPNVVNLSLLAVLSALAAALFCALSWRKNLAILAFGVVLVTAVYVYIYSSHRLMLELAPLVVALLGAFIVATVRSLDEQTLRAIAYALGLRKQDALLNSVVDSSSDSIVCLDARGRIQTANPATAALFGCDARALMGTRLQAFIPELPSELTPSRAEWDATNADGVIFPVELSISRVQIADDRLYTAIIRDISERRAQQGALEHQASHDPLTGLPNRAALARFLAHACANAEASKPVALFMLDLCRFKEVNDTLGHNVGDRVLCEVVRRFRETLGEDRFLARLGGDEFTVVIEDLDNGARMQQVVAEMQRSLAKPIVIEGVALEVGVSIGVSLCPLDAPDADALLKHADVAMFASKRRRTAYECYDAVHDPHSLRRLTMVSELRAAMGTPSLALHYQPKINLRTSIADSVEALMRWQHPTYGGVTPTEFIAVAEATDLIVPLTDWTLQQALDQVVRWRQAGLELSIAVNLSARVLQDVSFPERLRTLFERSDACADWLEIEVTEDSMMADPERAGRVLHQVHELGVRLSVDDYGTGYSSLGYLRNLPIHALKLDKSFVQHMRERADDRIIVESTVQMARALKLEVVAEGIETEWDARFLMSVGCDYGQGFWFSKALPAQECEAWVRDFNTSALRGHEMQRASEIHHTFAARAGF